VASIEKSRNKRGGYVVRYRGADRKQHSQTFKRKVDADRFLRTVEADVLRGTWVDPQLAKVTFEEYASGWLESRPNLRPRTRETYESELAHVYPTFGTVELGKITPGDVRLWHAELSKKLGPSTVAKCYRLLRSILATAVADERIARNPCKLDGAGVERAAERPVATVEQVWNLANAMPDRYRCLVVLAGFVGLRIGELLGLERRHVNVLHKTLTVEQQQQELTSGEVVIGPPKTAAGARTVALPAFVMPELERHLDEFSSPEPSGRVFPGEHRGPLRKLTVHKHWKVARAKVEDLPTGFVFHDLRHTANTLAASAGASTRELMHRMGHGSSAAALRYQHATRERDVEVARLLDELASRVCDKRAIDASGGAG
jgi:integrase